MPSLYVVATPIGNLEDITLRAIRILKEVKLIAAEDTRTTKRLLMAYDIKTPATSYHEHNKLTKLDYILDCLEKGDVALVSDAGMPGISDPGYELISASQTRGIPVIPIPGPSVLVTALAVSGLPTDSFVYLGFLPHKSGERKRFLKTNFEEPRTLVFFESPHRIEDSLKDMLAVLGDRQAAVCRELTKVHEEIFRGTLSQASEHFTAPRGEFTLVVAGKKKDDSPVLDSEIEKRIIRLQKSDKPAKEALAEIASETGLSKKELYQVWIKIKQGANQ
jgi:16S rRNA (cytidine1402-2'-O)-methyltransferase